MDQTGPLSVRIQTHDLMKVCLCCLTLMLALDPLSPLSRMVGLSKDST